jgi:hypothetical protein
VLPRSHTRFFTPWLVNTISTTTREIKIKQQVRALIARFNAKSITARKQSLPIVLTCYKAAMKNKQKGIVNPVLVTFAFAASMRDSQPVGAQASA